ncbi:retropepsin-like aspartic protease [Ixodes scapularis]
MAACSGCKLRGASKNVGAPPLERYQRSKRRPATVSNNLNVVIDGHDASALVDTGADYSVLSGRLSRRLRKVTTPWDGPQIRTAGGHLITPVGRCTARVEIHGETCPVKFVVLQDCSRDVILGMDFLCEYGAVIDLGETD